MFSLAKYLNGHNTNNAANKKYNENQVMMIKEKYGNGKYKKRVILDFLEKEEGIKMSNGTLNKILKGIY